MRGKSNCPFSISISPPIPVPIIKAIKTEDKTQDGSSIASENSLFGSRERNIKNGPVNRKKRKKIR